MQIFIAFLLSMILIDVFFLYAFVERQNEILEKKDETLRDILNMIIKIYGKKEK